MHQVRARATQADDWRTVVDALRPHADQLWEQLNRTCGLLDVTGGRIVDIAPAPGGLTVTVRRHDHTIATHTVGAAVNCTGPGSALHQPLVRTLLADGHARSDELALGLDTDPHGALIDATGQSNPAIRVIGPARRGRLWESSAVPEIRTQAEAVAADLQAAEAVGSKPFPR